MSRSVLITILAAACSSSPKSAPSTLPSPVSDVGADGHFTKERVYEGDCMPAGSRGGCHTVTLRPDGTFTNFLFDAGLQGTYTVEGSSVTMKGPEPDPIVMTLSPDRTKLDSLTLKP